MITTVETYKKHAICKNEYDDRVSYHYAGRCLGWATSVEDARLFIDRRVEETAAKKTKKANRKYKTWGQMEKRIAELESLLAATKYETGWRGSYGKPYIVLPLEIGLQSELRETIENECCEQAGEGDLVRDHDGYRTYKLLVDVHGVRYGVVYNLSDREGVCVESIGLARLVG